MLMQEPKVEFISIDMREVITTVSKCTEGAQKASFTTCDCSDGAEGDLAGCSGDIV